MSSGERKPSLTSPRRSSSKLDEYRLVHFNTSRVAEHKFCTNKITTYLYSWWNFAPKILFEELSKLPYAYFLFMTALQCIPIVSNTSGVPTLAPILTIMICASAALKLIEVRQPATPPPRVSLSLSPPHPSPRPTADRVVCVWPLSLSAPPPRSQPCSGPAPALHAPRSSLACRTGHATEPTKRQTTRRRSASAKPPSSTRSGPTSRRLTPHASRLTPHAPHRPHCPHRPHQPNRPHRPHRPHRLHCPPPHHRRTRPPSVPPTPSRAICRHRPPRHLPPPAATSHHRLQVGDVIRITNHQAVPADVLILAAHEPEPAIPRGACHVETKGLDGETNLKASHAHPRPPPPPATSPPRHPTTRPPPPPPTPPTPPSPASALPSFPSFPSFSARRLPRHLLTTARLTTATLTTARLTTAPLPTAPLTTAGEASALGAHLGHVQASPLRNGRGTAQGLRSLLRQHRVRAAQCRHQQVCGQSAPELERRGGTAPHRWYGVGRTHHHRERPHAWLVGTQHGVRARPRGQHRSRHQGEAEAYPQAYPPSRTVPTASSHPTASDSSPPPSTPR